jgi:hypothetical protein
MWHVSASRNKTFLDMANTNLILNAVYWTERMYPDSRQIEVAANVYMKLNLQIKIVKT